MGSDPFPTERALTQLSIETIRGRIPSGMPAPSVRQRPVRSYNRGLSRTPFPCLLEYPMFPRDVRIESYDPELAKAIAAETQRQEDHVELIASENYTARR